MGLVGDLRARGSDLAGKAMTKLLDDPKRAEKVGELLGMIQRGRKKLDDAQQAALKSLGVASRGEFQAAGKRLASLRRTARTLDEKLGQVAGRLDGEEKK
jgi:BMFP domain-containing protein YqiC